MADEQKIKVPDIGGATDVDVIEILVKEGDEISKDTSLITLESDKASMDIPSPKEGKIQSIALKTGDKVSEGDVILTLVGSTEQEAQPQKPSSVVKEEKKELKENIAPKKEGEPAKKSKEHAVIVPDIGGAANVDVIEILVKEGDEINKDTSIITLESDKASMEIPSPEAGVVRSIKINVGDKVSEGDVILTLVFDESDETETQEKTPKEDKTTESVSENAKKQAPAKSAPVQAAPSSETAESGTEIFAGPSVRRLAREFGVNLKDVKGTGRKERITKEDVQQYVKSRLQEKPVGGFTFAPAAVIDFSKFGETYTKPLNKIKRLTGENVHRSWVTIPHVTQFDEADITELESFRKSEAEKAKTEGYKLTLLAFVCKAVAKALAVFPQFNASLDARGEQLIYKKYFNIGVAAETPNGLVVPVIKEVDQLSVSDIAKEMGRLSSKAREKGLMPADMSGGCFTISSLGGIGGTAFTPIVNSPEVAILGLSRSIIKPIYLDGEFVPRLMLPLSLSYDHRVIDGAEAARFTRYLGEALSDIRKILL